MIRFATIPWEVLSVDVQVGTAWKDLSAEVYSNNEAYVYINLNIVIFHLQLYHVTLTLPLQ